MFRTICDLIPRDSDIEERARTLDILGRVLDGTLYESGQWVNRGVISVYAPVAVSFSAWEN